VVRDDVDAAERQRVMQRRAARARREAVQRPCLRGQHAHVERVREDERRRRPPVHVQVVHDPSAQRALEGKLAENERPRS